MNWKFNRDEEIEKGQMKDKLLALVANNKEFKEEKSSEGAVSEAPSRNTR